MMVEAIAAFFAVNVSISYAKDILRLILYSNEISRREEKRDTNNETCSDIKT